MIIEDIKEEWVSFTKHTDVFNSNHFLLVFHSQYDINEFFKDKEYDAPNNIQLGVPYYFREYYYENYHHKWAEMRYTLSPFVEFVEKCGNDMISLKEKEIDSLKATILDIENAKINMIQKAIEHQAPTA